MRVTHSMLYDNFITNMNTSLDALLQLNIKAQTQKKINKPSDDPVGMARILDTRDTLNALDQYQENLSTARGWLTLSDSVLTQSSNVITRARELAEQAATGTLDANNREEISYEVRQLFEQLIALSNSQFEGKTMYAGHKTGGSAFEERLWMTTNDENVASQRFSITGESEKTALIQFTSSGQIGVDNLTYRYSTDGGDNFTDANLNAGNTTITIDGVRLGLTSGTQVTANGADTNDSSGTWLWIRPTAKYVGDDNDGAMVDEMASPSTVTADAEGVFSKNVMVQLDDATDMSSAIEYSYSVDGGVNWVTGNTVNPDSTASNAVLSVPGGVLVLASNGANTLTNGSQYIIRPRTADIDVEISESESIRVNEVGKDIFGGVYVDPGDPPPYNSNASVVFTPSSMLLGYDSASNAAFNVESKNIFEAMGNLVAYLETNNQQGVQESLATLERAQEHLLNRLASVGGRENRLNIAENMLTGLKLSEEERLTSLEDADVGELMTDLAQQQIVYEAVMKSSSMIMRLSLMNYI